MANDMQRLTETGEDISLGLTVSSRTYSHWQPDSEPCTPLLGRTSRTRRKLDYRVGLDELDFLLTQIDEHFMKLNPDTVQLTVDEDLIRQRLSTNRALSPNLPCVACQGEGRLYDRSHNADAL